MYYMCTNGSNKSNWSHKIIYKLQTENTKHNWYSFDKVIKAIPKANIYWDCSTIFYLNNWVSFTDLVKHLQDKWQRKWTNIIN